MARRLPAASAALALVLGACARNAPREYELRGVVLAVDPSRQEITIKHDDIPRFMPGMTMPFKVRDARLLQGRVPGDLVRATLVVEESDAHLRTLERIGYMSISESSSPPAPGDLAAGDAAPDATFTDQTGAARRLSDWRGQTLAVTFIYTRCPLPTFCPLMDRHFKVVQEAIQQDQTLRGRVNLISVSIDPAYDRPPVLAAHARQLGADPTVWSFLTGSREEIDPFAARFGVSIVRGDTGPQEIGHNARTAVIDANGWISVVLSGTEWTPRDLIPELRNAVARR